MRRLWEPLDRCTRPRNCAPSLSREWFPLTSHRVNMKQTCRTGDGSNEQAAQHVLVTPQSLGPSPACGVLKPARAKSDACKLVLQQILSECLLTGMQPAAAKSLTTVNSHFGPFRVFQWSRKCLAGNTSTGLENTNGHVADYPDLR